ncbi:unnamed protein product [Symbiodinium natans]|uniref:Uncharacterized protein n=1 Tax=Symbiodinium natans TaxID=878477 RepID=A0A812PJX5_9DINO|nr:unnamed protein product [Symbiodinium natans]
MHGACDALFVSVEGGLSYEVFLLGLTGLEPDILGRHVVPSEALLRTLPRLRDMLAPRILVRAKSIQEWLQGQLHADDCPCAAHVWSALLDRLKAPLPPWDEVQQKVQDLQQRFLRLALGGRGAVPSTDSPLIAAEIVGLLNALGLRLPAKGSKMSMASVSQGDWDVEDLKRTGLDPGLGLQALSNGIKVIAGLQQLLRARYPGSMVGSVELGRQEELLLCAFRDARGPGGSRAVAPVWDEDSPSAFETPHCSPVCAGASSVPVPCSTVQLFRETQFKGRQDKEGQASQVAQVSSRRDSWTSASTGRLPMPSCSESVRADELLELDADFLSRGQGLQGLQGLPPSKLQPPSSWQSILSGRTSRWSCGASSCGTSPGSLASSRRRGSEPPGRKSDGFASTPRETPRVPRVGAARRDSYFDRMRARASRAIASKSPDPGITEAVKRAQHRARRAQQQQAEKDAADAQARAGPTGELVPHATARLFKRRDERLQRFIQRQETVTGESEVSRPCPALTSMESPQPLPSPEPCP